MSEVCKEVFYWGFLGLLNLSVSMAVYESTKLERHRQLASEYKLSTRHPKTLSFPRYSVYLSFLTGALNSGGAFLRLQQIQFLEIPSIPWIAADISDKIDEIMELLRAEWIVAMNDWSSLVLAITFFAAACFNFATVRQLRLRDSWLKESVLPVFTPTVDGPAPLEKLPAETAAGDQVVEENKAVAVLVDA